MDPVASHCPSCGTVFVGPWCAACGERQLRPGMRGLRHYLGEGWQALSDSDSRLWRSLWSLLRRPGALTRAWWAGRRRPYLGPIQLFLLVSVVFFLVSPFDLFSTPLRFHLHLDFLQHRDLARELVHDRIAPRIETETFFREVAVLRPLTSPPLPVDPAGPLADARKRYASLEEAFDRRSSTLARSLVFVMIPMLALASLLLAGLLRGPIAPTLHVVYATHFVAATQAIAIVMGLVLHPAIVANVLQVFAELKSARGLDMLYSSLFMVLLAGYLVAAAKSALRLGGWRALAHGVGLTLILLVCWNGYRALLFFLTFFSLEMPA